MPWSDDFDQVRNQSDYKVAIVSTAFSGQFSDHIGYRNALIALRQLGFNEVLEESMISEHYGHMIRQYLKDHPQIRPILSSNCPAVVRLIQVRFPSLLPNILHLESPMTVLALYYRQKLEKEKALNNRQIKIYQIVPCISQVTAVHQPEGNIKDIVNGAISVQDVFGRIMEILPDAVKDSHAVDIHAKGLSWAIARMEAADVDDGRIKSLAVSGIPNVIEVLLKIENQQIDPYDFIVLNNCTAGCVGGVLNVENPFIASSRIRHIINTEDNTEFYDENIKKMFNRGDFDVEPLEGRSIMKLSTDIKSSLEKMKKIMLINNELPGLDCSACGSPTCLTLAEDIVEGKATLEDCVVLLRKKIKDDKK